MGSRLTSTVRWRSWWIRRPGNWCSGCWATPATPKFVIARVRAAIDADPQIGGRLALWARRLVGEALAQAYRVVADRPSLASLLSAGGAEASGPAAELGDVGRMFARITDAHAARMTALGLAG